MNQLQSINYQTTHDNRLSYSLTEKIKPQKHTLSLLEHQPPFTTTLLVN